MATAGILIILDYYYHRDGYDIEEILYRVCHGLFQTKFLAYQWHRESQPDTQRSDR
jgi:hypothetical protein